MGNFSSISLLISLAWVDKMIGPCWSLLLRVNKIIDLYVTLDRSNFSSEHLRNQTQQYCLRLRVFYLYLELLGKTATIDGASPVDFPLEDVQSVLKFKTL